ncbi:MAG: hypothetical protein ACRDI0_02945 [Actinomycetota bacterium]
MSDPRDRLPSRRTEPLSRGGSSERPWRDPTEPLPASPEPSRPSSRPPRPTRWLVIGLLVLAGAFLIGFVVGRAGGGEEPPAGQSQGPPACRRAANLATRLLGIHREALANRVEFAETVAREDRDRMAELNAELEELSGRGEEIRERAERFLARCRS